MKNRDARKENDRRSRPPEVLRASGQRRARFQALIDKAEQSRQDWAAAMEGLVRLMGYDAARSLDGEPMPERASRKPVKATKKSRTRKPRTPKV
jgi:hypothetical protein